MATYYWVGGDGTWDATATTNWAASSGGAGDAGVPTSADNVIFDANSNTGTDPFTVTMDSSFGDPECLDFTASSLDGAMTLTGSKIIITGDIILPATNFSFSGSVNLGIWLQTKNVSITTNGTAVNVASFILFDGGNSGFALTLNDDLNLSGTPAYLSFMFYMTLGASLNLNNRTLTTNNVDLTNLNQIDAYRLIFGSTGKIVLTNADGGWFAWNDNSTSDAGKTHAYASGSGNLECTNGGGNLYINPPSTNSLGVTGAMFNVKVNGAGGTACSLGFSGGASTCLIKDLDCSGFSGQLNSFSSKSIAGNLTLSAAMTIGSSASVPIIFNGTSNVTTNGKTIPVPCQLTGSMTLQDAFTMSNTLAFTINNTSGTATLNLNNFTFTSGNFVISNNTQTRVIAFGSTGKIVLSRAGTTTTTVWNCPNLTNFSFTGTSRVETSGAGTGTRNYLHGSTSGGAESNAINLYIKTSPPTVVILGHFKDLDFTGSSSNLTQNSLTQLSIYGNLTLSATITGTVGTGVGTNGGFHFKGGSGVTQYITTNGNNIGCGYYAFEGAATYVLSDNITATAASSEVVCGVYVFNGIFDSNDKTISVNALLLSPSSGPSQMYLRSSSVTTRDHYFYTPFSYSGTLYPGTSTITITGNSQDIYFGGYNFNNVTVTASGNTTYRYGGTITNFTRTVTSTQTMTFEAGNTFTFGAFNCTGTASFRLTIQSLTPGSAYTFSKSNSTAVNLSYCTISDFFAGTASVWKALKSNGNINNGNNYGIQFTPPQGKGLQFFS